MVCQSYALPFVSGHGSQKSLNSSANSSWSEISNIVAASPEGRWPRLVTPRAGGRKGAVPRRLNTSSQLMERNHSWDLMSSAPRRRLPNRLVTSVCRRQEMRSFSTGVKKFGAVYLGSDRGWGRRVMGADWIGVSVFTWEGARTLERLCEELCVKCESLSGHPRNTVVLHYWGGWGVEITWK